MFSPFVRLLMIAVSLIYGIKWLYLGEWIGILLILGAVLLTVGYFRYGTVWLAFHALARGNLEKANRHISKINNPDRLGNQSKAYYYWIKGLLALNHGRHEEAKEFLERVEENHLRTANDQSILACLFAQVAIHAGDGDRARTCLKKARALPHKPEVDSIISHVEMLIDTDRGQA
jgi:uncharacterized protein HemY